MMQVILLDLGLVLIIEGHKRFPLKLISV